MEAGILEVFSGISVEQMFTIHYLNQKYALFGWGQTLR